jgi:hypothetical protein
MILSGMESELVAGASLDGSPLYVLSLRKMASYYFWQVTEEAAESSKTRFANMKNAVWHECFKKLLHRLEQYSQTGYHTICGDAITRWLFPFVLILSSDYEEM